MKTREFVGVGMAVAALTAASAVWACPMRGGMGMGPGRMGGGMIGGGMMGGMADMHLAHTLLANHTAIQRTARQLPDGVETVTTSKDPRVAALIPQHVQAMYRRLQAGEVIRGFDPLFAALFQNAGKIQVRVEPNKDGVRVVETSQDPYVVQLIKAHAAAVDGFVKDGMAAMHQLHPVPERTPGAPDSHAGETR